MLSAGRPRLGGEQLSLTELNNSVAVGFVQLTLDSMDSVSTRLTALNFGSGNRKRL